MERAAALFAERGIAATSLDEVLAAAGAGKGQFYHYFRGRDELAAAAVGHRCAQVVAGVTEALSGVSSLAGPERMRQRGELRADTDPAALATGLLASIEGGMVLSQTRKDIASLRIAVEAGLGQVRTHVS